MKLNLTNLGLLTVACSLVVTACKHSSSGDYTTDPTTGVMYHLIKHDDKGAKPAIGDYATMEMRYSVSTKAGKDSELFNSLTVKRRPGDTTHTITIPLRKSFNGCLEQGITLMSVGDSAEFSINADSLFMKTFGQKQLPPFVHPGSSVTFNIKLTALQNQQQIQQQQQQQMMKMQAEMGKRKLQEPADIAKYLADNHSTAKPSKDSLFFLDVSEAKEKLLRMVIRYL